MAADGIRRFDHTGMIYSENPGAAAILMTATVTPPSSAIARSDPAIRMQDYGSALSFYLGLPAERFDRIILADNSDSDLSPLYEIVKRSNRDKRVELMSFQANDHDPALGKAFGEFRIIDIATAASRHLKPGDNVWKTTGRLRCLNLVELEKASSRDDDFICDLYNLPFVRSGRWNDRGRMELRLFRFKPAAYDIWLRATERNGSEPFDEKLLFQVMMAARRAGAVRPRFPIQPRIAGVSGRTQRDYLSQSQRAKDFVRTAARRVAPWLWL